MIQGGLKLVELLKAGGDTRNMSREGAVQPPARSRASR